MNRNCNSVRVHMHACAKSPVCVCATSRTVTWHTFGWKIDWHGRQDTQKKKKNKALFSGDGMSYQIIEKDMMI